MGIFSKVANALGGGIIKEGFEVVKAYFPPSMSDKEKAEAQLSYERFVHKKELEAHELINEAEAEFNKRITDLEGTAADLKTIPFIGPIIIFIRGCQRPAWGIFVLYADYMVFSNSWNLSAEPQLRAMLFAVNILVLGFLFGERAVKNIMPFVSEFLAVRNKG